MTGRPWTADDDELLRCLWLDGNPPRDLPYRLKRTPIAVHRRRQTLGLPAESSATWSLARLIRETGHCWRRLRTVCAMLDVRPRHASLRALRPRRPGQARRTLAFSPRQVEQIVAYLATVPDGAPLRRQTPARPRPAGCPSACARCGGELPPQGRGRPPMYCTTRCQRAAGYARRAA